jgi:hypothetical protein
VRSFQHKPNNRRAVYLSVAGSVESQLREAYAKRYAAGLDTQVTLAQKLDVGRSVINKRLRGLMNMTIETIADMAWALGYSVIIKIFDPNTYQGNEFFIRSEHATDATYPTGSAVNPTKVLPLPVI